MLKSHTAKARWGFDPTAAGLVKLLARRCAEIREEIEELHARAAAPMPGERAERLRARLEAAQSNLHQYASWHALVVRHIPGDHS